MTREEAATDYAKRRYPSESNSNVVSERHKFINGQRITRAEAVKAGRENAELDFIAGCNHADKEHEGLIEILLDLVTGHVYNRLDSLRAERNSLVQMAKERFYNQLRYPDGHVIINNSVYGITPGHWERGGQNGPSGPIPTSVDNAREDLLLRETMQARLQQQRDDYMNQVQIMLARQPVEFGHSLANSNSTANDTENNRDTRQDL